MTNYERIKAMLVMFRKRGRQMTEELKLCPLIKAWNRRVIDKDKQEKAMTNLDYIKTLNIDQMYKFLSMECFDWCIHNDSPECLTADCGEGIKAWLKQPPHKMFWWKVN